MPPKTAKKEKLLWWPCEKCNSLILTVELSKHNSDQCANVDALDGFVAGNETFHSKQVVVGKAAEKVRDFSERHLNALVFMAESVARRIGLVLGDFVKLTVKDAMGNGGLMVRKIWPTEDKDGAQLNLNIIDEFAELSKENLSATVSALKERIQIAEEVFLVPQDLSEIALIRKHETLYLSLLKRQLIDNVVIEGNLVRLKLCNKDIHLRIERVQPCKVTILEELDNLCLGEKFYEINRSTTLKIIKNVQSDEEDRPAKKYNLENIGGMKKLIDDVKQLIDVAFGQSVTVSANIPVSRGALLYGVSGVGKTLLVNALAANYDCHVVRINSAEIFSKFYGESEANLAKLFNRAIQTYPYPTLIVVEELHNICPKVDGTDLVKRISQFFLTMLDELHGSVKASRTMVIATSDNVDNINPQVRRSGRIDYEFEIPVPNAAEREDILQIIMARSEHALTVEHIQSIARITHGYVGADLESLVSKAGSLAGGPITSTSLAAAAQHVKASAMREIMIESPNVRWTDIGGQDDLKLKLKQIIEWPIVHPELFTRLGITAPRGLLMFGPPGCSKTMIAKAIATESQLNFLSIKGSELFSMWVGESERAVRDLFRRARQVAPSIIFFDEIDAIGGERSAHSGSSVKERVLAQILTEMDGVSELKNVKIIAATNRPDLIDKALMRPGRLDRIIYVTLPNEHARREIFRIKLSKMPTTDDVDFEELVRRTNGHSGSEIEAICQEAALRALEHSFDAVEIGWRFFEYALDVVQPRTSPELLRLYDDYLKQQQ